MNRRISHFRTRMLIFLSADLLVFTSGFCIRQSLLTRNFLSTFDNDGQVINNELFATLVVMALITTAMTTPTLMWLYKPARDVPAYNRRVIEAKNAKASVNEKLRMLVCVHGMENVPGMMNLIHMSKGRRTRLLQVDALHLVEFSERSSAIRMAALANADDSPSDEDYEVIITRPSISSHMHLGHGS